MIAYPFICVKEVLKYFWLKAMKATMILKQGIPTTVTVKLPTIDNFVYKAWEHPIGHCHAHVWWSTEVKE